MAAFVKFLQSTAYRNHRQILEAAGMRSRRALHGATDVCFSSTIDHAGSVFVTVSEPDISTLHKLRVAAED